MCVPTHPLSPFFRPIIGRALCTLRGGSDPAYLRIQQSRREWNGPGGTVPARKSAQPGKAASAFFPKAVKVVRQMYAARAIVGHTHPA